MYDKPNKMIPLTKCLLALSKLHTVTCRQPLREWDHCLSPYCIVMQDQRDVPARDGTLAIEVSHRHCNLLLSPINVAFPLLGAFVPLLPLPGQYTVHAVRR